MSGRCRDCRVRCSVGLCASRFLRTQLAAFVSIEVSLSFCPCKIRLNAAVLDRPPRAVTTRGVWIPSRFVRNAARSGPMKGLSRMPSTECTLLKILGVRDGTFGFFVGKLATVSMVVGQGSRGDLLSSSPVAEASDAVVGLNMLSTRPAAAFSTLPMSISSADLVWLG
jgi:hypothetical protein